MDQVVKTWQEMHKEKIEAEKKRLVKLRDQKRGDLAQKSQLTMLTDYDKGIESKNLVEEIHIEKRLQRIPLYASLQTTWSPEPVKKATRKDFYRLIKSINTRKYEEPKSRKRTVVLRQPTIEGGILKKPSIIDLNQPG